MNIFIIVLIFIAIIASLLLIYFNVYFKLKKYKEKMDKAENIIDINLNKKLDLIIGINSEVKKVTNKKDYLKEFVSLRDLIMTNIEKDWKLDEAEKLINNLSMDFNDLNSNKKFTTLMNELRNVDEILTSAKNMFNNSALASNQAIKLFPNNIIAKIAKFNIRSFYSFKNNENDTF